MPPGFIASAQNDGARRQIADLSLSQAAESALGLVPAVPYLATGLSQVVHRKPVVQGLSTNA